MLWACEIEGAQQWYDFSENACHPRAVVRCQGLLVAARAITKQYFIQKHCTVQKHCSFFNRVKWDKASDFIKVPLRANLFIMFFLININNWHLSCPWDEWRAHSRLALAQGGGIRWSGGGGWQVECNTSRTNGSTYWMLSHITKKQKEHKSINIQLFLCWEPSTILLYVGWTMSLNSF